MTLSVIPSAAIEIQAGLWELTTSVEREGTVTARAKRSICVGPAAADAARTQTGSDFADSAMASLSAQFGKDSCKLATPKPGADLVTWRLTCAGDVTVVQEGTARFADSRHYVVAITTRMTVLNRTATSLTTIESRHIGACKR